MSYKIENVTFLSKKGTIDKVTLTAESGKITNVVLYDKEQMKFFKRVLKGKEKNKTGRFQLNNIDIVNRKFVKNRIEFIRNDIWFERLIPSKIVLFLSLLFDPKFLRKARRKTIDKKYDYLSFKASKNDISDMKLRRNIDATISQFIEGTNLAETKLLNNFNSELYKYDLSKIKQIYSEFPPQVIVLAREVARLEALLEKNRAMLTFAQVLWDNVNGLNELRDSCTCEFNAKKSSNKYVKKLWNKFAYTQTKYMIIKQLKFINFNISELRLSIWRNTKLQKQLSKQFDIELSKFYAAENISKDSQTIVSEEHIKWKKVVKDQRDDFAIQQKEILFDLIPTEGYMIGKKIAFLIHNYHKKILNGSIKYGNQNEFVILKKHYKNEIQSTLTQATDWTKQHLEKLDIKFDWLLKHGFKISSLNIIYLKILKAINLQKKNVVFSNILNLLNTKDFDHLMNTLKRIQKMYPDLAIIALNDNLHTINDLGQKIYSTKNNILKSMTADEVFEINIESIYARTPNSANLLTYKRNENGIEVENKYWNINSHQLNQQGKILINPFKVSIINDSNRIDQFPIVLRLVKTNRYSDPNMHSGVNKFKHHIFFYDANPALNENKEVILYINKDSISKII